VDQHKAHIITGTSSTEQVDSAFISKVKDYGLLVKFKLNLIVVISALLGYAIVSNGQGSWQSLLFLALGGFLVVSAANALNQVLEKEYDTMMERTSNRPLAANRMKSTEAVLFAGLSCLIGVSILALFNPLTALLGMLSMIIYAFVYTPMKRYSTLSVAVGAIPGALPVLIGATAFEGRLTLTALCLFVIQFLWQFPHFWAIGYLSFDDYKNAGFKLLPSYDGVIDRNLGLSCTLYSLLIIPVVIFMYLRDAASLPSTVAVILMTLLYTYFSYVFHQRFDRSAALKVMFFSFFYLPIVLLAYWLM
jgi:heme o synthase